MVCCSMASCKIDVYVIRHFIKFINATLKTMQSVILHEYFNRVAGLLLLLDLSVGILFIIDNWSLLIALDSPTAYVIITALPFVL